MKRNVRFVGGVEVHVRWWNKYGRRKVREVDLPKGAEITLDHNRIVRLEHRSPSLFDAGAIISKITLDTQGWEEAARNQSKTEANPAGQAPADILIPQRRDIS